jgi:hypothetical protein
VTSASSARGVFALSKAEDELANMKDYLNEVLKEIASIKKPIE